MDSARPEPSSTMNASVRVGSRLLLLCYLLSLLWLVLFKLSYDVPAVLADHQTRSLNLVPFAGVGQAGLSETVSNVVVFVPFGLLLRMNVRRATSGRLLLVVLAFSVGVETLQFLLAIGTADVTDVVTNGLGGLAGLALHRLASRAVRLATLDRVILVVGLAVLGVFLLLRVLVFRVRY